MVLVRWSCVLGDLLIRWLGCGDGLEIICLEKRREGVYHRWVLIPLLLL